MKFNADRLQQQLRKCPSDEARVELLDEWADELCQADQFEQAISLYARALELETVQNVRAYLAGQMGICYYNLKDDAHAKKFLQEAVHLFDPQKEEFMPDMYGLVNFHLASIQEYEGNPRQALNTRLECLKYEDQLPNESRWVLFSGISRNYEELGKSDKALQFNARALEVIPPDDPNLKYLYESVGMNQFDLGHYDDAQTSLSKVLELDPNFERKDAISSRIGLCQHKLLNHQLALDSYQKILELKKISGGDQDLCWLYIEIAHCHYRLKQYQKSLEICQHALEEPIRDKRELAEIRSYLTNNFYELGHYEKAVEEGEKTLKISRNFHNLKLMLFSMALSYYKLGDRRNFKKYQDWCQREFPEENLTRYIEGLKL